MTFSCTTMAEAEVEIRVEVQAISFELRRRLGQAQYFARKVYPGPVGEVLAREIEVWEEFGYRLGGSGIIMRLVKDLEDKYTVKLRKELVRRDYV